MDRDGLLDQVAARLAELPARNARVPVPLPSRFDRVPGTPGAILEAPWALRIAVRIFQNVRGLPLAEKTRRLYQLATGADDERCGADLAAVTDRLVALTSEPLVHEAARWLVGWVAAGRPVRGPAHERVEADHAWLASVADAPPTAAAAESFVAVAERYEEGWRALLAETSGSAGPC